MLSGFLITSLLLIELDRTGGIDFKSFYRDARAGCCPRCSPSSWSPPCWSPRSPTTSPPASAATCPARCFYYSNWLGIVTQTSYFELIGRPPMLKHLWSLAVEEQFYIFWPAIALLSYRLRGAAAVGLVALAGALLSTVAMIVGSFVGDMPGAADPSRLYFGTDTHAMGVCVGAALAVVWRPGRTAPVLARQAQAVITAAGAGRPPAARDHVRHLGSTRRSSTAGVSSWWRSARRWSSRRPATGACRSVTGSGSGRCAGSGSAPTGSTCGTGRCSSSRDRASTSPSTDFPRWSCGSRCLLGVAELSYRYLELPVRRGALVRGWERFRAGGLPQPTRPQLAAVAGVVAVSLFTGFRVVTAPAPALAAGELTQEQLSAFTPARAPLERDFTRQAEYDDQDPRTKVTAFGDSVLLGASGALEHDTFRMDLNAKVATQAADVQAAIADHVAGGDVRDTVLLHVGNNGIVTEDQLRGMLSKLSGVQKVVLVNVRVPRPWMKPNNALISSVAGDYPNVVVADWAKASEGHREYMVKDGVHLTGAGAAVFTALIAHAAGVQPS